MPRMTKAEMMAELDERGVEYPEDAKVSDLKELMAESEPAEEPAEEVESPEEAPDEAPAETPAEDSPVAKAQAKARKEELKAAEEQGKADDKAAKKAKELGVFNAKGQLVKVFPKDQDSAARAFVRECKSRFKVEYTIKYR